MKSKRNVIVATVVAIVAMVAIVALTRGSDAPQHEVVAAAEALDAPQPTAPIRVLSSETTDPVASMATTRLLDDRHWELIVLGHEGLTVLALRFDHVLGHGELARRFLISCCDALRESGDCRQ